MTSIAIPDKVTSIDDMAFCGCNRLTSIYYAGIEAKWNNIKIGLVNVKLKNANITYNYHKE